MGCRVPWTLVLTLGGVLSLGATGCLSQLVPGHKQASPDGGTMMVQDAAPLGTPENTGTPEAGAPPPDLLMLPDLALPPVTLMTEAEAATLTAPMAAADDALASGGKYIVVPAMGLAGKAVFSVNLPNAGDYVIWGRIIAPTDANNSFHVSIDADAVDDDPADAVSTIWDLPVQAAWTWVRVNMRIDAAMTDKDLTFTLTAGAHMIYLNQREELSQLDKIIVTSDLKMVPVN